jgi:SsrA-binding protein
MLIYRFCCIMRAMSKKKPKQKSNTIARNKRARHDYHLSDKFEAGIVLHGWEVKSLREGKVEITETYVLIKDGEAFLLGAQITPLNTVSTHYVADPLRTRKLLLHKKELARLLAATGKKGQTCVCTSLYWKGHLIKAEIALAVGKQSHDKRHDERDKDWERQKQRVVRENVKQ